MEWIFYVKLRRKILRMFLHSFTSMTSTKLRTGAARKWRSLQGSRFEWLRAWRAKNWFHISNSHVYGCDLRCKRWDLQCLRMLTFHLNIEITRKMEPFDITVCPMMAKLVFMHVIFRKVSNISDSDQIIWKKSTSNP